MPLFQEEPGGLKPIAKADFDDEKTLQRLIEKNLDVVFKCRFVATEFATGQLHAGRIDTLALSEDDNPVIIEYKRAPSSDLLNQSLFYLAWLHDHHGDFEIAAQKRLGANVTIDWTEIRVICIAPTYKKYDLHAVQMMGANIELWTYRRFANGSLFLEEVVQQVEPSASSVASPQTKNPIMVAAGKKAALTRATATWTFEGHVAGKPEEIKTLALDVQQFMTELDSSVEESPKKLYVAYRTAQNIVCMEVQKQKLVLFVKLDPKKHAGPPNISRDVSDIGHFGTGDLEITVRTSEDLELAKPYLRLAYQKVGG
jgi:predicted transport protein